MVQNITKFILLVLLIFFIAGFKVSAQNGTKIQQQFQKAMQYYNLMEYQKAISEIEKLLNKNPGYVDAILLLSDVYHDSGSTQNEIGTLEKALQYSQNPLIYFRLAKANYSVGEYEKALFNFEKYSQSPAISEIRKTEIERNILSCHFAINAVKNPVEFNPERLSENINTENDEYWPSISLDGEKLVFTRRQKTASGVVQEDFFVSVFDSLVWGGAMPINEINTNENEGAQSLSADGRLLFFTACNRPDGFGSCDIYYSVFNGKVWSSPKNAGNTLNSGSWDAQPSVSSDNRFLYFSSNRTGGNGKKDIWRAELLSNAENGFLKWGKPENLGNIINTEGDEISPFMHPNNKSFYFASDFHFGMGGLDLFQTELQTDGSFKEPQNLGFPINSSKDEQGLNISFDGKTAFFATERDDTKGLDIYSFELPEGIRPEPVTFVKAKITDAETGNTIGGIVDLVNLLVDSKNHRTEKADENGEILLCLPLNSNYAFNVSEPGYLFYSQSIQLAGSNSIQDPFILNIQLEPVKIGAEMNLYNIYFETDSFRILPESEPELIKLVLFLQNNSDLSVEIQGHTDNTGRPENNLSLSEQRAKSVVQYLISKGISPTRLTGKGFGETMPVAPNDTGEGRKLNRRTTVKIDKK
jgi:outer membrane protein OmpA-like peptidoglycan-associated protein